jgi:hypothetical protein
VIGHQIVNAPQADCSKRRSKEVHMDIDDGSRAQNIFHGRMDLIRSERR